MPHTKTAPYPYRVQVLDRALEILEVLGGRAGDWSLAELCAAVNLHKSTVHRLIMVLDRHRLVSRHPETGRYRLGLKLLELGSKAAAGFTLRENARPHLERLLEQTEETVHLCILDEGEMLYVDKMEPERSVRMASGVGRRAPTHSTAVGKAMLAWLPESEVDQFIRRSGLRAVTPNTLTTPAEWKAELRAVRARGYAVDNEENEEGVRCVGAPVWDYSGRPIAAVSVSAPAFRLSREKVPVVARAVMEAAQALSRELGFVAKPTKASSSGR